MMKMMLSSLSRKEQAHVTRLTRHLTAYMLEHYRHQPEFDPSRFPSIALCCAVENPELPLSMLEDFVKIGVWIFDFDSALDQRRFSKSELAKRLKQFEQIVRGNPSAGIPADPYGRALADLTLNLRNKPLFTSLEYIWQHTYLRMIDAMLFEIAEDGKPLTLETYLDRSTFSIGLPFYVISTWILRDDATALLCQSDLLEMLTAASTCIRLANDLQSADRERLEGKMNSLFIEESKMLAAGLDPDSAREQSRLKIQTLLDQHMVNFQQFCDDRIPHKKSLRRLTQFVVGFYRHYDFHSAPAIHEQKQDGNSEQEPEPRRNHKDHCIAPIP
ncbi:terpene synthase family protein [Brevibacillus dissolubilis]|uniref:terpene synthase family protein n=1 Tax=Brevibacillus dissolubilis TaxID=1844116 RepID=UPI00111606BB|nr:terpene synthase family protein [Brevibacillus dissolubilis]